MDVIHPYTDKSSGNVRSIVKKITYFLCSNVVLRRYPSINHATHNRLVHEAEVLTCGAEELYRMLLGKKNEQQTFRYKKISFL